MSKIEGGLYQEDGLLNSPLAWTHRPKDVDLHQHNNQWVWPDFHGSRDLTSKLQPEIPCYLGPHFGRVASLLPPEEGEKKHTCMQTWEKKIYIYWICLFFYELKIEGLMLWPARLQELFPYKLCRSPLLPTNILGGNSLLQLQAHGMWNFVLEYLRCQLGLDHLPFVSLHLHVTPNV